MKNYQEFKDYLDNLNLENKKKLLLHSCCAVCSPYVIELLSKYFDVFIYFINDNIYPKDEYYKRLDSLMNFVTEYDNNIKVIFEDYDENRFYNAVKGHESKGEKSIRCYNCYEYRLRYTARKAKQLKMDFFTTTLSISPHKNSSWVNQLGKLIEKEENICFLYSDFKKEEGYLKTRKLAKDYNLYSQNYCGCLFSYEESLKRKDINERLLREKNANQN